MLKEGLMNKRYDVVIIGGAIMGSSVAFWLANNPDFDGSVLVIEKDSTYQDSSTARSNCCIRQQFSTPENIQISQFGIDFVKNIGNYLTVEGESPDLSFVESGYLFLANSAVETSLKEAFETQKQLGVKDVIWQSPDELKTRFSWLNTQNITGATLGIHNEGWFDPYSLLQGFKRKARSLGVDYIQDEVIGLKKHNGSVVQVITKLAGSFSCKSVVNAAGPRARSIANMAGLELPVYSRKRSVFVFKSQKPVDMQPLIIDPDGMYVRREGDTFICGQQPDEDNDPECFDLDVDYSFFEERLWPKLADLIPSFEAIKMISAWAGHYEMNMFDHNALLGPMTGIDNFYCCNGFSGHGLQQSPAVGKAISELIIYGNYRTLDLSRLSANRLKSGKKVQEIYVV